MELLRTLDDRFENLPDYPFKPNYLTIIDRSENVGIRVHYIDEGAPTSQTVLMLHGEP
jgi:haloalkane dehalogenase